MDAHRTEKGIVRRLFRSLTNRSQPIAVLALLVCLSATAWGWHQAREQVWQEAQTRFDFRVNRTLKAIEQRMDAYEQVLRGGVAFMNSNPNVTRDSWRSYIRHLELEENYPGILGTGYVTYTPADRIPALERKVQADGFPGFQVWPKNDYDDHAAIIYLEPFDWRNQRAFGYNMLSQSTRREALLKARDEGRTTVSGKVLLMQETAQDIQAGFLMYLPVYRGGIVPPTVAERRENILGFVYSPFRMNDLMRGILDGTGSDLTLQIFDGTLPAEGQLIYGSPMSTRQPLFETIRSLDVSGHHWTAYLASPLALEQIVYDSKRPLFVLLTGLMLSLLLFALLWSNAGIQARASAMAQVMAEAFRRSEAKFFSLVQTARDAIIITDSAGRIVSWNQGATEMFGYREDAVLNKPWIMVLPERLRDEYLRGQRAALLGHGKLLKRVLELTAIRDSGEEFPVEVSLTRWGVGGETFLSAIIRDTSERQQARDALNRAYRDLEQRVEARTLELRQQAEELARSNAELEQFAYVASHDLQEPLRSVSGFAQLLQRRYQDQLGEEGLTFVHFIVTGTDRMRILIKDLLTYSRAGAKERPYATIDSEAVLNDVLASLSAGIGEREAEIVRGSLPIIWGDAVDLEQLFLNLVANALKFNQSPRPRIEIMAEDQGTDWLFSVRDNGIGIDPAFSARLFTIFQRGHRRDDYDGTGIGLAICKKVVESYQGRIWAEPNRDAGTTFFFTLPKAASLTAAATQ